ncbi:MAG TPA: YihY/virulence factor BrkB family protein [Chloroflexia bacterium]|nr:YihY/virulence factor BrkB family protein [Chloroflexia bacterium]
MTGKEFLAVTKATAREFGKDDVGYMAAALTYYVFFSVFPMLLLAVTLAGLFLNELDARIFIFSNVAQVVPGSVELLQATLEEALKSRESAGWLALIGFATLIFSASGAFDALDKAINRAWSSEKMPNFLVGKLTSFAMMLVIAALLVLSVIISTTLAATRRITSDALGRIVKEVPGETIFWWVVSVIASLAIIFLGFALLYRFVPRCKVSFRDIWPAALIAAVAWTIAKEGFALFLGSSFANYSAVYGTLGTVIALLTWIYISSIIVLVGAEFSAETARVRDLREKVGKHMTEGGKKKSPWLPT